ncbi:hypothetical protein L9F63_014525, partial [Diploptera punctata]
IRTLCRFTLPDKWKVASSEKKIFVMKRCTNCTLYACSLRRLWTIRYPLALSSAESPFSQTIKSKNEKRIFVPSTDRIRNLFRILSMKAQAVLCKMVLLPTGPMKFVRLWTTFSLAVGLSKTFVIFTDLRAIWWPTEEFPNQSSFFTTGCTCL